MPKQSPIAIIAFDMFETLVHNKMSQWDQTFVNIVKEQNLSVSHETLHSEWSSHEVNFRYQRTDLENLDANPVFKSYDQAWFAAFQKTFAVLQLEADPRAATDRCVADLGRREAFTDTNETLGLLREDWPLGILSNADNHFLSSVISHNGWSTGQSASLFKLVVSSESAKAYKPNPEIFAAFCREASVAPSTVLYVGDSPYDDIHGAKLAGMQTVLVNRGTTTPGRTPAPKHKPLEPADHNIRSLRQLIGLLEFAKETQI